MVNLHKNTDVSNLRLSTDGLSFRFTNEDNNSLNSITNQSGKI